MQTIQLTKARVFPSIAPSAFMRKPAICTQQTANRSTEKRVWNENDMIAAQTHIRTSIINIMLKKSNQPTNIRARTTHHKHARTRLTAMKPSARTTGRMLLGYSSFNWSSQLTSPVCMHVWVYVCACVRVYVCVCLSVCECACVYAVCRNLIYRSHNPGKQALK